MGQPSATAVHEGTPTDDPILRVEDLRTYFQLQGRTVKALDGVSFDLRAGETLGIVGESGSGKTMTALSILRLIPSPNGRIVGGHIWFRGEDLTRKSEAEMQRIRGRRIAVVPQDPLTSLNPTFTIGDQVTESISLKDRLTRNERTDRAAAWLGRVKVSDPRLRLRAYPHQMSGGMRQRVVGAIAFLTSPEIVIADEPTTSLDATVQLQYLNLLRELQAATGVAIIFITHDFGIVAKMCHRVAVMYAGRIVELATVEDLFKRPSHPYTRALIRSVPDLDSELEVLPAIPGQPPALGNLPRGCAYAPRCEFAFDRCRIEEPPALPAGEGHEARCWLLTTTGRPA
jgi:oligopeptide/dipeptide ABC transporter ATP-binding protein